jgi:DNA-binding CsgD family transcriptional regulator
VDGNNAPAARLALLLEADGDPIAGVFEDDAGNRARFVGWIELISLIQRARGASSASRPPRPAPPPRDGGGAGTDPAVQPLRDARLARHRSKQDDPAAQSRHRLAALGAARGGMALAYAEPAAGRAPVAQLRRDSSFEHAHHLLALGRDHRRAKRRRLARESFNQAVEVFEQIGAIRWAEVAREELSRCGLRVADGELTPTEERVARLAAQGLANREIAVTAYISPKTVEANLARAYRKLGIRSRAQLGAHFALRDAIA